MANEQHLRFDTHKFRHGALGAIGEQQVVLDLLERGYEVFKACNPSAPYDLIVDTGYSLERVEVKMNNSRTHSAKYKTPADVLAMVVSRTEILYTPEFKEDLQDRVLTFTGSNTSAARTGLAERRKKYQEKIDENRKRREEYEQYREKQRLERIATQDRCAALRKSGKTLEQIGAEMGRSVAVVNYWVTQYEIRHPEDKLPRAKRGRKRKKPLF
jgi:PD-(D/E)XK endonuclease